MRLFFVILMFTCVRFTAQQPAPQISDSLSNPLFERGRQEINKCTPWHHMKCVFITTTEVYQDGTEGKSTRHWWRMSYIGQACTQQYGAVFGTVFEGFFALPHYVSMGLGNATGYMVYLAREAQDKRQKRRQLKRK